jgi:hypothetical protein
MIVGIRVESENIKQGGKNCNSSYFTMDPRQETEKMKSSGLILSNLEEVRRFCNCLKQISLKKKKRPS